ncbi:MAG TPA: SRPBCC family protein [Hyphomonas sp.]|nr:SRPBCC family protein [Hyphomonas sp.]
MPIPSVTHASFTIERLYKTPPGKVFAAFADPAKKRRWYADRSSMIVDSVEMDFRVGGHDRYSYRFGAGQPLPEGTTCINNTVYMDIVPDRRIVFAYTMAIGGSCISSSQVTLELLDENGGTLLVFTEQAGFFEGADGPDMRRMGQEALLAELSAELDA